ncbi:MAG: hypothetical protein KQI81_16310 [Deltaproteobacteria bacterium]|uniref:hypothetical protein n=1 Tax=uncultured Desulfosarcina sp. TaxID=218289 RepID=UPI0029C8B2A6|nr:hypothetical protein [uncultured Desulfosarcina sp.]MCB2148040.1 hypothetical protein [Deltaproteobacteria bacterium]
MKLAIKKSILTFLVVFVVLGGMSSSASDGMTQLIADSRSQAVAVAKDAPSAKEDSTTTSIPNSAIILLIATGLVGLAGVSRRKNL